MLVEENSENSKLLQIESLQFKKTAEDEFQEFAPTFRNNLTDFKNELSTFWVDKDVYRYIKV